MERVPIELTEELTDYLGHVTAYAHLKLLEEARWRWLRDLWHESEPAFVLARQELDYRRELLVDDGPAAVEIAVERLSRSSFTLAERIVTSGTTLHTTSRAVLVRWDRSERCSTPLKRHELALLARHIG
ncbi:acyl-CoA thioesterase [Streptomyces sp. NPDC015346]|uniref:acyl-CoA thioesterase n=1 Tax=Streptomyces sp. NPDC015346 TaxID=3364954 RepID=UPI0036FD7CCE